MKATPLSTSASDRQGGFGAVLVHDGDACRRRREATVEVIVKDVRCPHLAKLLHDGGQIICGETPAGIWV